MPAQSNLSSIDPNWQKMLAVSERIIAYIWNLICFVVRITATQDVISKPQLFRLHKWCGLSVFALILIQAASGGINAFRYEAGQLFDPTGMVRQSDGVDAPLSEVLRTLRDTHPEHALERIVFPKGPRGVLFANLLTDTGKKMFVAVDPGSAIVLRSGTLWAFPAEAAAGIHYNLTIGLPGILIVAAIGILCLAMAATGYSYWWPQKGRRMQRLAINWQAPGKMLLRQLHRTIGVVMSLMLSFSLITGVVLAVDYFATGLVSTPVPATGLSPGTSADIDALIRQARLKYPERRIRDVRFVDDTRANVFLMAPERSPRAVHQVSIDLSSGTITTTADASSNSELWVTWLPLHTGEWLGTFGLILIVSNALALFLMAASGPIMWFKRVKHRRGKSR